MNRSRQLDDHQVPVLLRDRLGGLRRDIHLDGRPEQQRYDHDRHRHAHVCARCRPRSEGGGWRHSAQPTLSWTAPTQGGAPGDYEYCQKTDSSACGAGDWTSAGTTGASKVVSGLDNGTRYTFRVRAKNGVCAGPASAAATVTPVAPPAAPAAVGLTATLTGSQIIMLSWTASTDSTITGYEFCQKAESTATCNAGLNHPDWADILNSTWATAGYEIVGLNNGTQYTYRAPDPAPSSP